MNEFESFNFDDFRNNFLVERDLDHSPRIPLGEVSKELSKTNLDAARKLNSWAAKISTRVDRYANKLKKKNPNIQIRSIPVDDSKTEAAAIIIIDLGSKGEVEASVFDNNKIAIRMTDEIAKMVNKGRIRKFLSNKDKVADYLIGILERVAQ